MLKKQVSKLFKQLSLLALAVTLVLSTNIQPVHADDYWKDGWITAEIDGTANCSISVGSNGRQTWESRNTSAICYAHIQEATGNVQISVTGSGGGSTGEYGDEYSYGWSATAEFDGVTASNSGNTITFDVGSVPVSGTIKITTNASASVRTFRTSDSAWASCSVTSVKYKSNYIPEFRSYHPEGTKTTWTNTSYATCTAYSQTWDHSETEWINFDKIIAVSSKYKLSNGTSGYIYLLEQGTNRKLTICEPHYAHSSNTHTETHDGVSYTVRAASDVTGSLDTTDLKGFYKICYEGASYNNNNQVLFYPVDAIFTKAPSFNSNLDVKPA